MYSKGISWIDDCRIPHNDEIMTAVGYEETKQSDNGWGTKNRILEPSNRGRFPANILVSDDMLNDGVITKGKVGMTQQSSINNIYGGFKSKGNTTINDGIQDKGTNSRFYSLDKWFEKLIN